ncbi:MAG: methyltransferase [Lactobacillales bacterium]|jgi:23S rRNA G2445 N2-methylase RlmL|nr:methyltransferase [Lactobacillales bacterium]
MIYYSTFITGFDQKIADFLKQDLADVRIHDVMAGAVVYETSAEIRHLLTLKYLNNTFLVIHNASGGMESLAKAIITQKWQLDPALIPFKAFKTFISQESQLTSLPKNIQYDLIEKIKRVTRRAYDVFRAQGEFWLMLRHTGAGYFMLRLSQNKKKTQKGELRPELAHILCRLSNPKAEDVFCDPFCGSGAIALERSLIGRYRGIFAMDIDETAVCALKEKTKHIKGAAFARSFFIKKRDFFNNSFESRFLDAIVTDPPWGLYQPIPDDFYPRFMLEAGRVIKQKGRLVLLTKRDQITPKEAVGFRVLEQYDILLSGQKASVWVFERNGI